MKRYINNIKALVLAVIFMMLLGCEKDFLDINTDPNNPSDVQLSQLIVFPQINIANSVGFNSDGLSLPTSILMHQTNYRGSVDGYLLVGSDYNVTTAWQSFYSGTLTDLERIIKKGTDTKAFGYVGMAQVLKAYSYSMMVDVWGDIPFTKANKGVEEFYPAFGKGEDIYSALFNLLDTAIINLDKESTLEPGSDDLYYAGDLTSWKKLAKSIKLKMYNQIRLVQDVSAPVSALIEENDFISEGEDFELAYGTTVSPNDRNPGFVTEYTPGNKNTYISPYFYEIMMAKSDLNPILNDVGVDPRVPYYWFKQLTDPAAAQNPTEYSDTNGFVSIFFSSQGENQGWQQDRSSTVLGLYPIGGKYDDHKGGEVNLNSGPGNVPQRLVTHYSVLYTRAELALSGITNEDPEMLFREAMRASFNKVNDIAVAAQAPPIDTTAINDYIEKVLTKYTAASNEGRLELLMTEKWIANFGFAIESYTDYRRTGYPKLFDPNTDDNEDTNVSRGYPVSFPYSQDDLILYPNPPAQKEVTTDRVFWDPS